MKIPEKFQEFFKSLLSPPKKCVETIPKNFTGSFWRNTLRLFVRILEK